MTQEIMENPIFVDRGKTKKCTFFKIGHHYQQETRKLGKRLVDEMTQAQRGLSPPWKLQHHTPAHYQGNSCETNDVSYLTDCIAHAREEQRA